MDRAVVVCPAHDRERWTDLLGACGVEVVASGAPGLDPVDAAGCVPADAGPVLVLVAVEPDAVLVEVTVWRAAVGRAPLLVVAPCLPPDDVPVVLRAGADGVLPVEVGTDALGRSLAALLRGEVVVPRSAVAALVEAARDAPLPTRGRLAALSPREAHVLRRLSRGLSVGDIAVECGVAETTVRSHLSRALGKLRVRDRSEAVALLARSDA